MLTQQCTENHLQLVTTTFTQSAREKGVDFEFHTLEDADFLLRGSFGSPEFFHLSFKLL